MTLPVVIIAAVARNGAIGLADGLPWRLPGDLAHFKAETMGKPVVMGRRTFASLGRPLPGRSLVVVSRDRALALPAGTVAAASLDEALERAEAIAVASGAREVMVAGGAEIYRAAMARADVLRLTEVDLAPQADALFPPIDPAIWRETSRVPGTRGPRDEAGFTFVEHARAPERARASDPA
ncbi:dihydrofolate reductase [Lichenibacterium ramalinae]|uniref:Dihydrofolate reductase n=1 Tax=Lichenibacterium ramalinae TaxID=2316527 RepID=A0A4Q2RG81_9HYPH|nr:dihydrofolate reductase [Lichenibacterium ramalinae]RYB07217.1 dihydrofolate reductase [Lichenibacterium ramalinae]